MGSRLYAAVERYLTPWRSRKLVQRRLQVAEAAIVREERKAALTEKRHQKADAAVTEANQVRVAYAAAGERLRR